MSETDSEGKFRDDDLLISIGQTVRQLRHERMMTQEQLAIACGVPTSQISRIERADTNWAVSNLTLLAKGLKVSRKVFIPD